MSNKNFQPPEDEGGIIKRASPYADYPIAGIMIIFAVIMVFLLLII